MANWLVRSAMLVALGSAIGLLQGCASTQDTAPEKEWGCKPFCAGFSA